MFGEPLPQGQDPDGSSQETAFSLVADGEILEAAKPTAQIYGRTGKNKSREDFVLKIIPCLQTAPNLE